MSIDRLYSLRELSEVSGLSVDALYESVCREELESFRRTRRGKIYVRESAYEAWRQRKTTVAKPQPVVLQLNPPHVAPARQTVDIDDLLEGFPRVFPRSA